MNASSFFLYCWRRLSFRIVDTRFSAYSYSKKKKKIAENQLCPLLLKNVFAAAAAISSRGIILTDENGKRVFFFKYRLLAGNVVGFRCRSSTLLRFFFLRFSASRRCARIKKKNGGFNAPCFKKKTRWAGMAEPSDRARVTIITTTTIDHRCCAVASATQSSVLSEWSHRNGAFCGRHIYYSWWSAASVRGIYCRASFRISPLPPRKRRSSSPSRFSFLRNVLE